MELKHVYPYGILWNGGDPLFSVLLKGVWVNISTQIISKFLCRLDFQLLANTSEIDHHIERMQKVNSKTIKLEDKFSHFSFIVGIISILQKYEPLLVVPFT